MKKAMEKCFVIQPFDNDKFDKRYFDVFKPAIEKAGYDPYRIDEDLTARILIDEIEKGIAESSICFAEITTDNPNVWYELGYAFACGKDVVMVCSDERTDYFPFDIQHKHIIKYQTGSTSDFNQLENTITKKIKAISQSTNTIKRLNTTPIVETKGLKSHEVALLILITENSITKEEVVSVYDLQSGMNRAGYTDIATSIGVRTLESYQMIETFKTTDEWNNHYEYVVCRLTKKGEEWIFDNQDLLEFRRSELDDAHDDDLPF